jgi:tetratricopeptide (TPR) repeat protein
MKLTALTFIIALAVSGMNPAEIYNEGNGKYRAGDYEGALARYNSITTVNPGLEYNRGAAYLKTGKLGKAAVHFRRALKLRPGDKDAQASLDYINSVKPDREKPQKSGVVDHLFADVIGQLSVDALAWAALALYYLAGTSAAMLLLSGGLAIRRRIAIVCAVFAALTIVSGSALAALAFELKSHDMAVAVDKAVDALAEPSDKSDKLFTFHEGSACRLGRREGKYVFVTLESGISGWVEAVKLEII